MADKIKDLIKTIGELTVMEVADLVTAMEEEFGVTAAAPVAVAAAGPAESAAAAEEQTEFNVEITAVDASKKISVIKELRAITSLGLKEAKEMAEKLPAVVKEGLDKAEAEALKKQLEAAGATVAVK